jgi:serine/threonine-protein kinase
MLYEMLTGRLPFQGAGIYDRLVKQIIPPCELDPNISPQLQEVIYRALERDPRNRYASANEFERDLKNLDQVGVADRPEIKNWKKETSTSLSKIALYALFALIPIALFALMLYFARK